MASRDEVGRAMLDYIKKMIDDNEPARALLDAAEAYAWVASPGQPHGGARKKS